MNVDGPRPSSPPNVAMPTIVTSIGSGVSDDRNVADLQPTVLGRTTVDHDLLGRQRRPSLHQLVRVESGIIDPVAGERRRTFATELLAIGAGQLTEAFDLRCDLATPGGR